MMGLYLATIRDSEPASPVLGFDLREVLAALGDIVDRYVWCVLDDIEVTGDHADAIHERVDSAPEKRLWLSAAELKEMAGDIMQTIDGTFAAFPKTVQRECLTEEDMSVAEFPENEMALVIMAIDSSFFQVYAKDEAIGPRIEMSFKDVRRMEPTETFG